MRVVTVANLKGGTTKTTTAAFLAHAWHEAGRKVLLVDADPGGSALRWSELAEWPFPALGLAVGDLHKRLPGLGRDYELVVVDSPPFEERRGIVASALRAADDVVLPVSPTLIELDRLSPILEVIDEVTPLRPEPPRVRVLLTRVVTQARSGVEAREALDRAGYHVLDAQVGRREQYAQAFGEPITAAGTEYEWAAAELREVAIG